MNHKVYIVYFNNLIGVLIMIAYKKNGDGYIVIYYSLDPDDNPILPEDAILTPPPEVMEDHHLTIENGEWVQVPNPPPAPPTLEEVRDEKVRAFSMWERPFLDQPFIYDGHVFPNDSRFKEMITPAVQQFTLTGKTPKLWLTADMHIIEEPTGEFLLGLSEKAYTEQENNMITSMVLYNKIRSCNSIDELNAVEFPVTPTIESLMSEIEKSK